MWTKEQVMDYTDKLAISLDPIGHLRISTTDSAETVFETDFNFELDIKYRVPTISARGQQLLTNFNKNMLPLYAAATKLYGDNRLRISKTAYARGYKLADSYGLHSDVCIDRADFWDLFDHLRDNSDTSIQESYLMLGIGSRVRINTRGAFRGLKGTVAEILYTSAKKVVYKIILDEEGMPKCYFTYPQLEVLDAKFRYENADLVEVAGKRLGIQEFIDGNRSDFHMDNNRTPESLLLRSLVDHVRPNVTIPLTLEEFQGFVEELIRVFEENKA